MQFYTLNEQKVPVVCADFHAFSAWFRQIENRRVDETVVGDRTVSTVFLGIGIGETWHEYGEPPLFETMVFDANGKPVDDGEQLRYRTWEEAKKGHRGLVRLMGGMMLLGGKITHNPEIGEGEET